MPLSASRDTYERPSASFATAFPEGVSGVQAGATPDTLAPASPWHLPARRNYRLAAAAATLAIGDSAVAALCATIAHLGAVGSSSGLATTVLIFGVCTVAGMHLAGTHYPKESYQANERALKVLLGVMVSGVATVAVSLAWPAASIGRSGIVVYYLLALPLLTVWHLLGSRRTRARFKPDLIAVVGPRKVASEVARSLSDNDSFRLGLVLVPLPSGAVRVHKGNASGTLAAVEDIPSIIEREDIGSIAVASSLNRQTAQLHRQLWNCRNKGVDVLDVGTCLEMIRKKLSLDHLDGWHTPSLSFPGWDRSLDDKLKRICDIFMAVTGMILCAPVMLAAAVAIRWSDGGPVIYSQQRVGTLGRTYTIYKFRSMMVNAEPDGPVWSCNDDPRAFPVGRMLRNTYLDELPQLWNVLKGDMSMIGPRPERPQFVAKVRSEVPYYDALLVTRPGITGWAQVNWPRSKYNGRPMEGLRSRLEYDLYYVRYRNVLWDIHIAAKTVVVMLKALWRYRRA